MDALLKEKILVIGENIKVRRFARFEGHVAAYIHAGGRIGVLVNFDTDVAGKEGFADYAKDIAMQVAAANPGYLNEASVPAEVIAHEIIHQWWGIGQVVADPENSDWSSEALTCYATYRLMETLDGEEYAKKNYV